MNNLSVIHKVGKRTRTSSKTQKKNRQYFSSLKIVAILVHVQCNATEGKIADKAA